MLRLTFGKQHGFTLIELAMAMGVAAIIMAAVTITVTQLFNMNNRNTIHMSAVRNVQTAGYWVSHDAQMAPKDGGASPAWISATATSLFLVWRDSYNYDSDNHTSTISWNSGDKTITRVYDGGPPSVIARNISSAAFSLVKDAKNNVSKVLFVVTASVSSRGVTSSETRSYEVSPRPGQAN